jgi:hypothetical protein
MVTREHHAALSAVGKAAYFLAVERDARNPNPEIMLLWQRRFDEARAALWSEFPAELGSDAAGDAW